MVVSDQEKDKVQATEYVRELTDEQLVALDTAVTARTILLMNQGVPVPLELIRSHHLIGLLEAVAGPEISLRVREWHLTWADRQFDKAEAQLRAQMLTSGLFDEEPNGNRAQRRAKA